MDNFKTVDAQDNIWVVEGSEDDKALFISFKEDIKDFLASERYFISVLPGVGICIVDDRSAKKPLTPAKQRRFFETSFGRSRYAEMAGKLDALQRLKCSKHVSNSAVAAPVELQGTLDTTMTNILKKYVCWTASSSGDGIIYVRLSLDNLTWGITNNPLISLKSSGLYNTLESEIKQARKNGSTSWATIVGEDGVTIYEDIYHKLYQEDVMGKVVQDECFHKQSIADFTNDPGVDALCYFPIDSDKRVGHCQHWLNFESQMPEVYRPVWRSLFAGIFDAKNRSRQIAILHDRGQTGKSNMIRAINNIAGSAFMAPVSKGSLDNQFWGSKIYGKRLVVFSDSGNAKITQMDKIKQITGGDPVDIERKGQDSFLWVPNCRVIVTTNKLPELDIFQRHQTSRMVLIPLERTTDPEVLKTFCKVDENGELVMDSEGNPIVIGADYETRMTEEFWDYLELCRESYEELCPTNMETIIDPIITNDMFKSSASEDSDMFSYILTHFLRANPTGKISNSDVRVILNYISENSKGGMDLDTFREFARSEGYQLTRIKTKGIVVRGFAGIELRPNVHIINGDVRFTGDSAPSRDIVGAEEIESIE